MPFSSLGIADIFDVNAMSSPTPTLDVQLDLLADAERRRVLTILADAAAPLMLREIANELVTQEHASTLSDVPAKEVRNAFIRLHHGHIPKLAEAGVIDYDADRQRIDHISLNGLESTLTAIHELVVE